MAVTSYSGLPTDNNVLSLVKNRIRALRKKHKRILQMEESLPKGKPLNKDQQELLNSKHSVITRINTLENLLEELVNETKENTLDKERYLCVSDGFAIYCLDLKQHEDQSNCDCSHIPPLPKISNLNLPEKGLPILTGLFKLGSNAYIIGGRKFQAFDKDPHHWLMDIFRSFANSPGLNGSSCVTYRLSLVDGNLSLSECNDIKPLNSPVAWPIVEKIGDEIHVLESFPIDMFLYHDARMAKHEVLDLNDLSSGWTKIRHMVFDWMSVQYGARIFAHLAVGDRIYTRAKCPYKRSLVFDSGTRGWEEHDRQESKCTDPFSIDTVAQILMVGRGRCVGGFLHGELHNSLYVVFAIVEDERSVHAVAYLVTIMGKILCLQRVPRFFEGLSVGPTSVIDSTVINVDEESMTMCTIIDGKSSGSLASECLFIYTFTVKELPNARLWIRDLWKRRLDVRFAIERDFVEVVVKGRHVYKTDGQAEGRINRMQACFL